MAHTNYRRKIKRRCRRAWHFLPAGASKYLQSLAWRKVRRQSKRAIQVMRDDSLPRKIRHHIRYDYW